MNPLTLLPELPIPSSSIDSREHPAARLLRKDDSKLPDALNRYFKIGCKSFTRHELLAYGGMEWHRVENCLQVWESKGFIEVLKSLHEADDGEVVAKVIHLIDDTGQSFEPVTSRYKEARPHLSKMREEIAERIEVPFTDFECIAKDKETLVTKAASVETLVKEEIQEQALVVPLEPVPETPKVEYALPPVEIEPDRGAEVQTPAVNEPEPSSTSEVPEHQFLDYLKCDLPLGYPFKTPLSQLFLLHIREHHRKELIRQQFLFLCEAEKLTVSHPSIAYIAALKHEAVLNVMPMESSRNADIADKRLFKRCAQKCKRLQSKSRALFDRDTAHSCERLVLLQSETFKIAAAEERLLAEVDAGFTSLETLFDIPPKPPKPMILYVSILLFGLLGLTCFMTGAVLGHNIGVMIGILGLGLVGIGGFLIFKARRANAIAAESTLASWMAENHQVKSCQDSIHAVTAFPSTKRAGALNDLNASLELLEALRAERRDLEVRFISPFVRDSCSPVDALLTASSK